MARSKQLSFLPPKNLEMPTPSPSTIPLLFLISVYLDNDWPASQEEVLLDFLIDYMLGKLGVSSTSLPEFLNLMQQSNLDSSQVNLVTFLKENIPKMTEHRYALESFLKEISALIDPPKDIPNSTNLSRNSFFGLYIKNVLLEFEQISFEQAGLFFKEFCLFCDQGLPWFECRRRDNRHGHHRKIY